MLSGHISWPNEETEMELRKYKYTDIQVATTYYAQYKTI